MMGISYEMPSRLRWRLFAGLALLWALVGLRMQGPPVAAAQNQSPDAQVYIEQAQPTLADATSNLADLEYYLPLASINDADDPTWGLAQQASDAVRDDAGTLQALSPPDPLAPINQALIAALDEASNSADTAIAALSSGDTAGGQAAMSDFAVALRSFAQAQATLPQAAPASGSG